MKPDDDDKAGLELSTAASPTRPSHHLFVGLCFLIISTLWAFHSYIQPGSVLHGLRISSRPYNGSLGSKTHDMSTADGNNDNLPTHNSLPAVRTVFGGRGTFVYGWPSTGGVWIHNDCYGVELNFLGVSRFESSATERYSQAEDQFCKRLQWIGATFYESEEEYDREVSKNLSSDRGAQLWTAWPGEAPEGGVWALWVQKSQEASLGLSRIRNAHTMKERCDAIEMLGGQLYAKWEDIPARPKEEVQNVRHGSSSLM